MQKTSSRPCLLSVALSIVVSLACLPVQAGPTKNEECRSKDLKVSSEKNRFGHKALTVRIEINAPPNVVWEAIRENRNTDPDVQYSKFTDVSETQRILEQKYVSLPVLGATTCTLNLEEELHKRIDYNLIKSDRLAEFEGSWVLTPSENHNHTILELSNHVKLNIPVPQRLLDAFAAPKIKSRLIWVKKAAEIKQNLQIASKD